MEPEKSYGLEIGLMVLAIVLAIAALYVYVRLSPKVEIPAEYFFRVREAKVRQRRDLEAKAKLQSKAAIVDL